MICCFSYIIRNCKFYQFFSYSHNSLAFSLQIWAVSLVCSLPLSHLVVLRCLPCACLHVSHFVLFRCVALTRLVLSSTPASPSVLHIYVVSPHLLKHTSWLLPGEAGLRRTRLGAHIHNGLLWSGGAYRWHLLVDNIASGQLCVFLLVFFVFCVPGLLLLFPGAKWCGTHVTTATRGIIARHLPLSLSRVSVVFGERTRCRNESDCVCLCRCLLFLVLVFALVFSFSHTACAPSGPVAPCWFCAARPRSAVDLWPSVWPVGGRPGCLERRGGHLRSLLLHSTGPGSHRDRKL